MLITPRRGVQGPVANAYSDLRNAIKAWRSAGGRAWNRSRAPAASPPWSWIACSGVAARPSCRNVLTRSEEHTSELQSRLHLVCRLLLEKKKNRYRIQ